MKLSARQTPHLVLLAALAAAAFLHLPASAQTQNEWRAVVERMQRLEAEVNQLQRQVNRGGTTPSGAPARGYAPATGGDLSTQQFNQLSLRMDELESLIRQLTGRIEEIDHRTGQTASRMDKLVQDVDFRLAQLERQAMQQQGEAPAAAAGASAAAATPAPTGAQAQGLPQSSAQPGILGRIPASAVSDQNRQAAQQQAQAPTAPASAGAGAAARARLPAGSAQDQYAFATGLLHRGEYDAAEIALGEFVKAHPKDALASAAQYWLGESHYVRQQYREAAQSFLAGYQTYPKGTKAPDSLLKLAMSLNALRQKQEACTVFQQLAKEFPNAEARIKQQAQREQAQAGCK
ncbi:MAG: tol-pal system protein YbgF [Alphaproteobacteria bacterium]|nr:tol-pal system protein YbgF [Alphaproteobacteria bacterium]